MAPARTRRTKGSDSFEYSRITSGKAAFTYILGPELVDAQSLEEQNERGGDHRHHQRADEGAGHYARIVMVIVLKSRRGLVS